VRPVDTDALQLVARSLGVGNPATSVAPVSFDDATLQQSLEVSKSVGRARANGFAPGGGLFSLGTKITFSGGGAQSDSFGFSVLALPPTLNPQGGLSSDFDALQTEFDLWCHWASAVTDNSAITASLVTLRMLVGASAPRLSITEPGGAGYDPVSVTLALWNSQAGAKLLSSQGNPLANIGVRIPKANGDTTFQMEATVSGDVSVFIESLWEVVPLGYEPTGYRP